MNETFVTKSQLDFDELNSFLKKNERNKSDLMIFVQIYTLSRKSVSPGEIVLKSSREAV